MTDDDLARFARSTRRRPSADFTTRVFARIGLDRYATASSVLGDVFVAWTGRGVRALRVAPDVPAFERWYEDRFARRAVPALEEDGPMADVRAKLRGEAVHVPLDLEGCSPFEAAVLREAAGIPRGHARSYGWLARELRAPSAARAVGGALGRNPVPLLIPCHRVVRADLEIGDYVFGSDAKRRLLEDEGVNVPAVQRVMRRGFRYIGCDDGYFCLPTCGDVATKLERPGYLGLHSADEAHAAGFAPCATCRPIAA